jgi:integrase
MPSTRTPKLRRHKPSRQGVVTLNGHDHYLGSWPDKCRKPPSDVQAAYDALVSEWLASGRVLSRIEAVPFSVAQLVERYWLHVEVHYRDPDGNPTKEQNEIRLALRPVCHLYADLPASSFGPLKLKAVRQLMTDGYQHPRYGQQGSLARRVINQRAGRIVRAFKWAASEEIVPVEVYQALRTVRGLEKGRTQARETEPVQPVALEIVEATYPFLLPPVVAMARLQLLTGMRSGEVTATRGCDIDTSGAIWLYRPARHKTAYRGKERVIALGPKAQAIVKEYLKLDTQAYLFSPHEAMMHKIATSRFHKKRKKGGRRRTWSERYSSVSYVCAIAAGCRKANRAAIKEARKRGETVADDAQLFPAWHPHQLRHTHGTEVRRRFGLEAAQVTLGHSQANVTEIYAERDLALAVRVAAEIG